MFGNLQSVRIKAAEKALRDGRVDEAFRLATMPDLRILPRAAAVLVSLVPALLARARDHFRQERLSEAEADLDRAAACCGGGPHLGEIAELRAHVQAVGAELQRKEQLRRGALDEARRRLEAGSLVGGERVLAAAGNDVEAVQLRGQIARRGEDAARAAREAAEMMSAGQWGLAAERIRRARSFDPHDVNVVRAEAAMCKSVIDRGRAALQEGRIGRAADELKCLLGLGDGLPEKRELSRMVQAAMEATNCIASARYDEARQLVVALANELRHPNWLVELQRQLADIDELQNALRSGPLGIVVEGVGAAKQRVPQRPLIRVNDETVIAPQRVPAAGAAPDRLLLIVDGGGSYLVLRGGMAGIGRAASEDPADVALLSDIGERHATISRMEEDYFLLAARDVEVAGQMTRHRLLRDGDRLVLGRKAKMTFHLPSRCSASAVLALSDTTKMPQDVRRVVLLNRHATIGNGPTSHILCREATGQLILFERDGGLWVRSRNDGHADTEARPLQLGEPMEMGGVRLVLKPWQLRTTSA